MELITKLGIDWKLLIAQIINFLILLFILYKFAYRPILEMLQKRSKTIEKGMHDAKASEERLKEIEQTRRSILDEAARSVGKLLEKAKTDAETMKKDLMAEASAQAEDLLRRTKAQVAEEKEKMTEDVKKEVAKFIILATGKILQREFSDADQKRLADAVALEMRN
ncbi:F0F1 ATP synthase subunit B [Candidatus Peregrinibacteria bacterium]|nr:F0F1 ATP synthase subunit B [Candidatus Peregrinibacteria bacterium]